jgi:hypothetical protein
MHRSAALTSPPVVATAVPPAVPMNLGIPLNVPPWLDTEPTPPDTQHSTQSPDSDGFLTITSSRGRATTAAAAFLPPETVGVPQGVPTNAFAALTKGSSVGTPDGHGIELLDNGSSVETTERHSDELRPVAGSVATDLESIRALLDKSFDEFFGPDSPPAPTPLRIKGLFDAGARLVDRLLSEIHEEHHRHTTRTDQQLTSITDSALFTRGALRADVTLLRTETEETLGPAFCTLSGLAATAQRSEQNITGLMETSARTTQDMLELRREIDRCGTLSGLAAMARKSEKDIIGMMETSAKNDQAILELCQEIAGCVAVKTTVDDIKLRQLKQIRENITRVANGLDDMTTRYSNLTEKYSEAFDAINIRVDHIIREGIPPTPAPPDDAATPTPMVRNEASSPSSSQPDGIYTSTPANVVPDSAPARDGRLDSDASEDMPCSDAPDRRMSNHARNLDRPNMPRNHNFGDTGGSSSVRWCPHLDPRRSPHDHGTFQREEGTFGDHQGTTPTPTNPYYGSRDTRNDSARSDPRRYTAHVPPNTSRPQEVDVDYGSDDEAIFPEGARSYPLAIGIGANLLTPLGIALSMPRLLLVRNITGISGGTILSLPRSFPSVDIGTRAGRFRYTAMILFSSTEGLWMHGKIPAHNRVVHRWIEF